MASGERARHIRGSCEPRRQGRAGQRPHRRRAPAPTRDTAEREAGRRQLRFRRYWTSSTACVLALAPTERISSWRSHHATQPLQYAQDLPPRAGRQGKFYSLPALEKAGLGKIIAPAGLDPHRARIGAAQLRRQEGRPRSTCGSSRAGSRRPRAPTRSPSWSRASCCRTSPACRCSPTSRRCAAWRRRWARTRRSIEPLVPVDLVVDHSVQIDHYGTPGRARPQHEARVPAQRRALPVHEVGHAGLRHLQGRAARASASCTR